MSIGKRFVNLVRANLSSLIDRSSGETGAGRARIENLSDADLERELQERRARREAAERAATDPSSEEIWSEVERAARDGSGRFRTSGRRTGAYRRGGSTPGTTGAARRAAGVPVGRNPRLVQLYAQLECPYGADLTTVRKHYRQLMRKFHPDMHSAHPEKQKLATELSQRLTSAYNELRRSLSPP